MAHYYLSNKQDILLIYDGECPVCNNYCRLVRIRQNVGKLCLVNAREQSEIMAEITARGIDIDHGMVLKIKDEIYYGADAIHMLALISNRLNIFNRINYFIFSSKILSKTLYPILRLFRNLLLKLLGKQKINNSNTLDNLKF